MSVSLGTAARQSPQAALGPLGSPPGIMEGEAELCCRHCHPVNAPRPLQMEAFPSCHSLPVFLPRNLCYTLPFLGVSAETCAPRFPRSVSKQPLTGGFPHGAVQQGFATAAGCCLQTRVGKDRENLGLKFFPFCSSSASTLSWAAFKPEPFIPRRKSLAEGKESKL